MNSGLPVNPVINCRCVILQPLPDEVPEVRFSLPFTPTASKNGRSVMNIKKRRPDGSTARVPMLIPTKRSIEHKERIREAIREVMREHAMDLEPFTGRAVNVHFVWRPFFDDAICTVTDLGPLSKIPGPRRDLANMKDVLLDAMTKVLFPDDSQVRGLQMLVSYAAPDGAKPAPRARPALPF